MIKKQLGIKSFRDVFYFLITVLVASFITLIFIAAFFQIITGRVLFLTLITNSPIKLNIQFPYLLGLCIVFMYVGIINWISMSIASIFYKRKSGLKANSEDKLVSIIIPACNEAKVIKNLILDLLSQSYKKFEILVIAHNCNDDSAEKAREIDDERVKVIKYHTQIFGKGLALNRGLEEAKGELIAQFDADNRIKDNDFLSKAVAYFNNPQITAIQANVITSNRRSSLISLLIAVEYDAFAAISWTGREVMKLPALLAGTGTIIKKSDLEEIGGWNNSLVDDFELYTRLSLKNKIIHYADNLVIYDEKPVTWSDLFRQRSRWVRGHLRVTWKYLEKFNNFFDYLYRLSPLAVLGWLVSTSIYVFYFITGQFSIYNIPALLWVSWTIIFYLLLGYTLFKKGGLRLASLLILYWFFAHHWVGVFLVSLTIKSWQQTKTTHNGEFSN